MSVWAYSAEKLVFKDVPSHLKDRILYVLCLFPELEDWPIEFTVVTIEELQKKWNGGRTPIARVDFDKKTRIQTVRFQAEYLEEHGIFTKNTVGHELVHVLSSKLYESKAEERIPMGERATDLWTLARSLALCDEVPCYIKPVEYLSEHRFDKEKNVDPIEWEFVYGPKMHEVAKQAIEYRKAGMKNYLQWAEKQFTLMVETHKKEQAKYEEEGATI